MEFIDATALQLEESPSADAFIESYGEHTAKYAPALAYRKGPRFRSEHIDYNRTNRIKPVNVVDNVLRAMLESLQKHEGLISSWVPPASSPAAAASPAPAAVAAGPGSSPGISRSKTQQRIAIQGPGQGTSSGNRSAAGSPQQAATSPSASFRRNSTGPASPSTQSPTRETPAGGARRKSFL